jgi:transcriptional regulator with XRE-family HTH domain
MPAKPPSSRRVEAWDVEVGRRIRARRIECELSQEELGGELGITFQQVQKYEKGANRVSAGRLRRIGDILQVPITFFYDSGAPARSGQTRFEPTRLFDVLENRDSLQLVTAFNRISDRNFRRALVRVVENVAGPETVSRKKVRGG